jgi:hypothetical protein
VLVKLEPAMPLSVLLLICRNGGGPGGGASPPSLPQDKTKKTKIPMANNLMAIPFYSIYKISVLIERG